VYLENLVSGHSYTYHVKSTNMVGDSEFSDRYTFLMVDKPSKPLQLQMTEFTDQYVSFMWKQPMSNGGQALKNFKVYRQDCSQANSTFVLLNDGLVSAYQFYFSDSSVEVSRKYKYAITALNQEGGESEQSNTFEVIPAVAPLQMAAPTEVTHDTTSITLQWVAPSYDGGLPISAYRIYYKADYESAYTEVYSGLTFSYHVTQLRPGFEYTFKVMCENEIGGSPMSVASSRILTALIPGDAPTDLTLIKRSATDMTFDWIAPVDKGGLELSSYNIYVAVNDGAFEEI
jgi:fibronectin type 3 domain-containing protein